MPSARTLGLAGLAFLAGLAAAALLLGGALLQPEVPAEVRVLNHGPREAGVTVEAFRASGGVVDTWRWALGPQASDLRRLGAIDDEVFVRVSAVWAEGGRSGSGERTKLADPADCGRDETLRFAFELNTTSGVSFPRATAACFPRSG